RFADKDMRQILRPGPKRAQVRVSRAAARLDACYIWRMTDRGYALFDTAIGRCGVAWTPLGIVATCLAEPDERRARARLRRRCPGGEEQTPPPAIQRVIDRVVALLRGTADDLADIPLDMEGVPEFNARIYAIIRTIPPGETITY